MSISQELYTPCGGTVPPGGVVGDVLGEGLGDEVGDVLGDGVGDVLGDGDGGEVIGEVDVSTLDAVSDEHEPVPVALAYNPFAGFGPVIVAYESLTRALRHDLPALIVKPELNTPEIWPVTVMFADVDVTTLVAVSEVEHEPVPVALAYKPFAGVGPVIAADES